MARYKGWWKQEIFMGGKAGLSLSDGENKRGCWEDPRVKSRKGRERRMEKRK